MKFIVFAFDKRTHKYLSKIPGVVSFYFDLHASEDNVQFRVGDFNKISVGKFRTVHAVMKLGYNTIFSDPDVVILQDPMPLFSTPGIDYMHSVNARCSLTNHWTFYKEHRGGHEGNTGFYFIRSNPTSIALFEQFFKTVPLPGQPFHFLDDQTLFWKFLRLHQFRTRRIDIPPPGPFHMIPTGQCHIASTKVSPLTEKNTKEPIASVMAASITATPLPFHSCHLDICQFPAGAVSSRVDLDTTLQKLKQQKDSKLYMIHANYMEGNLNKQQRLMEEGLWLATRNAANTSWSGMCQSNINNGRLKPYVDIKGSNVGG